MLWQQVAEGNCFPRQGKLLRLHGGCGRRALGSFGGWQLGYSVQRMVIKRSLQGKELLQEKQDLWVNEGSSQFVCHSRHVAGSADCSVTHRHTWENPDLILFLVQSSKFLKTYPAVSICVYYLVPESTENERAYYISSSDVLVLAILFWICHLDWRFISHCVSSVSKELSMSSVLDEVPRMRHPRDKWRVRYDRRHRWSLATHC